VNNGTLEREYIGVVNIHVDSSKVKDLENFKGFINKRLQYKYDSKTNGLLNEQKEHFYLMPCIWTDNSLNEYV